MHAFRCKAEANQLLKTEFGEFTVDNRCWMRNNFSLTQVFKFSKLPHPAQTHISVECSTSSAC